MTGMSVDIIQLDKGWEKMKEGIDKFTLIMERDFDQSFPLVLHSELYAYRPPPSPPPLTPARIQLSLASVIRDPVLQWSYRKRLLQRTLTTWARRTCYAMCTQKAPHNCADDLYKKYGTMYEEQLQKSALPAIKAKKGEAMLQEFAKRWKNHKLLVRQMWKLFVYLDRFYIKRVSALPLKAVGVQKFEQVVFNAVKEEVRVGVLGLIGKGRVRAGVLGLIEKEREGEEVNRELLKSVVK
ncbi:Cullin repeat-like-containing domain protein, partial [Baffinella frigidus]